jgi:hypothetical protein
LEFAVWRSGSPYRGVRAIVKTGALTRPRTIRTKSSPISVCSHAKGRTPRRVREEIYSAIRVLIPFPHRGHPQPHLTFRPLIAYAPDEKPLCVIAAITAGATHA